jgi:hypothetical protein
MRGTALWIAVAVVAAFPTGARAEEAAGDAALAEALARVDALEDTVEQHKKDKDEGALGGDLDAIVAAHVATNDEKLRDRLNGLLGAILKTAKDDDLERRALQAIAKTGDESNWRYVREYVQQPDPKKVPPLLEDGIECVGKLRPDSSVDHLLKVVDRSKVYSVAARAIKALGNFGDRERVRTRILAELVKSVRRNVPGGATRGHSDPHRGGYIPAKNAGGDTSRWGTLAPALVSALNQLTGQSASTAHDWFDLYDRYKSDLRALFPDTD